MRFINLSIECVTSISLKFIQMYDLYKAIINELINKKNHLFLYLRFD